MQVLDIVEWKGSWMTGTISRGKTGHRRLVWLGVLAVLVAATAVAVPVYLAGGGTTPTPLLTTYLWNVADQRLSGTLRDPEKINPVDTVTSVAFASDGKTIATTAKYGLGDASLWDARTHRLIATLRDPAGQVEAQAGALGPDGKILAVGGWQGAGHNYLRLWDVSTRRLVKSLVTSQDGENATAMAFSPNGKTIAYVGQNNQVLLWTIGTLP